MVPKYERGQAIILIAFAIVGFIAIVALALDGGNVLLDRRRAQNAVDTAAYAAALAKIEAQKQVPALTPGQIQTALITAAKIRATSNGYPDSTITVNNPPQTGCGGATNPYIIAAGDSPEEQKLKEQYIQVIIKSTVNTYFAPIIGIRTLSNCVEAIGRAKPVVWTPLFNGNALVGLKPDGDCAIDTGTSNSKTWTLTGGGIFSNNCVKHTKGTLNVPDDECITAVGSANVSGGGTHACVDPNQTDLALVYPADIAALMPPNPCTGAITAGRYAGGGKVPDSGQTNFTEDVFCISDFSTLDAHVVLTYATLYVTDTSFDVKFNGGGEPGFFGTATKTVGSPYKDYYMIIALLSKAEADKCNQNVEYRGNGNNELIGTILAPSTCWDFRGNSTGDSSQLIFYKFTSNGDAELNINYAPLDNATGPEPPVLELAK